MGTWDLGHLGYSKEGEDYAPLDSVGRPGRRKIPGGIIGEVGHTGAVWIDDVNLAITIPFRTKSNLGVCDGSRFLLLEAGYESGEQEG